MLTGKDRMRGFGGSEIGAVCGKSPYQTREEAIRAKALGLEIEVTWPMRWGHLCEPTILQELRDDFGWTIEANSETFLHSAIQWAFATPDALATQGNELFLIQCKAPQRKRDEQWGRDGSGDAPAHVVAQVIWEMDVLRSKGWKGERSIVAARFGANPVQMFHVPYDARQAEWIHEMAGSAWVEVERLRREAA